MIDLKDYTIGELCKIRDALVMLDGLGLHNRELLKEVEEAIKNKQVS
jgi:hypothetical protein